MKTFPIEVRFGDLDPANHVHNVAYFHYTEMARVKLMEGTLPNHDWLRQGFVVGENYMKYIKSIVFNQNVTIAIGCDQIGNKSFRFTYKIYADDILASEGWSSMVCVDFTTRQTIEIPNVIKQELEKLQS